MAEHTVRAERTRRDANRAAIASGVGTAIAGYDFVLYGAASALVIGPRFYPNSDPVAASLFVYSTFATGLLARPVGSVVLGRLGDRVGRKRTLAISLLAAGLATGCVGLLPSFETLGVAAPVILVVLRVVQGLAAGGQWGSAAVLAVEHAGPQRRGLFGGFTQVGTAVGVLAANNAILLTAALFPAHVFLSWGWRLPFLVSFPLAAFALWIRSRVAESPEFREVVERGGPAAAPVVDVVGKYRRRLLLGILASLLGPAVAYAESSFVLFYGTAVLGMDEDFLLALVLSSAAATAVSVAASAALADRFGPALLLQVACVATAVLAVPFFLATGTANPVSTVIAMIAAAMVTGAVLAPLPAVLAQAFPAAVRCTGVSASFEVGAALAAGLTPVITTALVGVTRSTLFVALFLAVIALVSAGAVRLLDHVGADA